MVLQLPFVEVRARFLAHHLCYHHCLQKLLNIFIASLPMVSKFTLYEAIQSPLHECFNYYDNSTAHKLPIQKCMGKITVQLKYLSN